MHVHLRASPRVRRIYLVVLGRQDVWTKTPPVSRPNPPSHHPPRCPWECLSEIALAIGSESILSSSSSVSKTPANGSHFFLSALAFCAASAFFPVFLRLQDLMSSSYSFYTPLDLSFL